MRSCVSVILALLFTSQAASSAETITYSYDAKGRVTKVVRSGPPGTTTTAYDHDKADNRRRVLTAGAAH